MEPDVTRTESLMKAWAWVEANRKPVQWGASALAGLGLVVWFIVWQHGQKELKAGEALSEVFVGQALTGHAQAGAAEAYLKVAANYTDFEAGSQAMLLAAGSLFTDGKYKEAQVQFERFAREHPGSPMMGQALLGIAACLESQNLTSEAVTHYKSLIDQHPSEAVIPEAKFALARLYELQNKPDLARNLYEEVTQTRYGSLGSIAGLRLEELYQKHPELAKPAAVAAVANAIKTAVSTNATKGSASTNAPILPEKR